MPALPWVRREAIDPDVTYVAMASRLPLSHYRSVPGFMRDALAIRRQLAGAAGLIGYALDAELTKRTFWTFSVWREQEDLDAFAASDPHRRARQAGSAWRGIRCHVTDGGFAGGMRRCGLSARGHRRVAAGGSRSATGWRSRGLSPRPRPLR